MSTNPLTPDLAPIIAVVPRDNFSTDPSGPVSSALWTVPTGAAEYIPAPNGQGTEMQPTLPSVSNGVIPPKGHRRNPREFDKAQFEARHLIENFFCWVKQFRAIATRYDKTAGAGTAGDPAPHQRLGERHPLLRHAATTGATARDAFLGLVNLFGY